MFTGPDPDARNDHTFETQRLTMAVPDYADAGHLYELVGGEDRAAITSTLKWGGPDGIDDVTTWIERCRTDGFEDFGFHWTMRDKATQRPIGSIGTRPLQSPGRADVGYWLGANATGHGHATMIASALTGAAFDLASTTFVTINHEKRNVRSAGVPKRLGFTERTNTGDEDVSAWIMTADDWG